MLGGQRAAAKRILYGSDFPYNVAEMVHGLCDDMDSDLRVPDQGVVERSCATVRVSSKENSTMDRGMRSSGFTASTPSPQPCCSTLQVVGWMNTVA
jgi:hypothetical protein